MKMAKIPIVIGVLGTVTKVLVQGLEDFEITGGVRPSKLLHNWDRPEYCEESCCHSNSSEKP